MSFDVAYVLKEFEKQVTVEDEGKFVVVHTNGYIKQWKSVNELLKEKFNAEWVSLGKQSHWRIPLANIMQPETTKQRIDSPTAYKEVGNEIPTPIIEQPQQSTILVMKPREVEIEEAIQKVKQILQQLHLNTFNKYREAGLEIIKSGYKKGVWHSKDRKKALDEWAISQSTFSYMTQLGGLTDEEFTNVVGNFASVHAWANRLMESHETELPPLPEGKFRTIIVDPPWPMKKILREERPLQEEKLDYQTMDIKQIKEFPLRSIATDGCHIYLWTTHKFLPTALEVFKAWGVEYECLLTWVKNVGFTPYSWMYSTEHVLFGRVGSLELLKKGERLDFHAKVTKHSRKPDEFYELVRKVSPEPRANLFAREERKGFKAWGNEIEKLPN